MSSTFHPAGWASSAWPRTPRRCTTSWCARLCSCYPHDLLGDPPWWYRDDSYKERIVRDPRGTLAQRFNLRLPDTVEVRVHDSTSDVRWMVLPRRPAGTEGWSEEELARLVTIDALVGAAEALSPASIARTER